LYIFKMPKSILKKAEPGPVNPEFEMNYSSSDEEGLASGSEKGVESYDEISDVDESVSDVSSDDDASKPKSKKKPPSKKNSDANLAAIMSEILKNDAGILSQAVKQPKKAVLTKEEKKDLKRRTMEVLHEDGTIEKISPEDNVEEAEESISKPTKKLPVKSKRSDPEWRDPSKDWDPRQERSLRKVATQGVINFLNEVERFRRPDQQTEDEKHRNMFTKQTEVQAITTTKSGSIDFLTNKKNKKSKKVKTENEDRDLFGKKAKKAKTSE